MNLGFHDSQVFMLRDGNGAPAAQGAAKQRTIMQGIHVDLHGCTELENPSTLFS